MKKHITANGTIISLRSLHDTHLDNIIRYNKDLGRSVSKYVKEKIRRKQKGIKIENKSYQLRVTIL